MAHHIAVCKVHNDEIILLCVDCANQFVLHLVCAHLRFEVVCSHLRRRNEYAVLVLIRHLATAVEEERNVSVLLCLGCMELFLALFAQELTESVLYILFREKDIHALERCIVRSHAIVLQSRYGLHALFRHILLCENLCEFLRAVVAEVDEDNHIALAYSTVYGCVCYRFDELIGHALGIALLHCLHHICGLLTLCVHNKVVSLLHAVPTLVAVHCIEASDDARNVRVVLLTYVCQLLDEAHTALRVGVATVHEAMYESVLQTIFL